jgi:hypothetical protein
MNHFFPLPAEKGEILRGPLQICLSVLRFMPVDAIIIFIKKNSHRHILVEGLLTLYGPANGDLPESPCSLHTRKTLQKDAVSREGIALLGTESMKRRQGHEKTAFPAAGRHPSPRRARYQPG